jgi:hypothetical protein
MGLSDAHKEAYARAQVDMRHLRAIELSHSTFGTIRLVNYTSDITVDGDVYTAHAMEIKEPDISIDANNDLGVRIDGASGMLQPLLYDASQVPETLLVTLKPFGYNVTTGTVSLIGELNLEMKGAAVTSEQVVLSCGFVNSANLSFPSVNYTNQSHPGLY